MTSENDTTAPTDDSSQVKTENETMTEPDAASSSVPMRKRTVTACDQCRRRKTKCDGAHPCATCSSIGLDCSYGTRIKQARGPKYVGYLEKKVSQLETQMKEVFSGELRSIDDDDDDDALSGLRNSSASKFSMSSQPNPDDAAGEDPPDRAQEAINAIDWGPNRDQFLKKARNIHLETIRWPHSRPDVSTRMSYGSPCGLQILRRLRAWCSDYAGVATYQEDPNINGLIASLDFSFSIQKSSAQLGAGIDLPSEAEVVYLVDVAFREAFILWPFLERGYIDAIITYLFRGRELLQDDATSRDNLALLQAVLALGQRNDMRNLAARDGSTWAGRNRHVPGAKYFIAASQVVDTTNCSRNLVAVQAMLCFAIYTQSINAVTLCNSFTNAAAAAVLRMGLHELPAHMSYQERSTGVRIWSATRTFDTYANAILGLPSQICLRMRIKESHDRYPLVADPRSNTSLVASEAHSKLTDIIGQVVEMCYYNNEEAVKSDGGYSVQYLILKTVETNFDEWAKKYSSGDTLPLQNLSRPQLMLELCYEYCRILFTSPFSHSAAEQPSHDGTSKSYAFATQAIMCSNRLTWIVEALENQGNLNAAHPYIVHALSFAAVVLLHAEFSGNTKYIDDPNWGDFRNASARAHRLLTGLTVTSDAAAGCLLSLTPLYASLRSTQQQIHRSTDLDMNVHAVDSVMLTLPPFVPSAESLTEGYSPPATNHLQQQQQRQ